MKHHNRQQPLTTTRLWIKLIRSQNSDANLSTSEPHSYTIPLAKEPLNPYYTQAHRHREQAAELKTLHQNKRSTLHPKRSSY